MKWCFIPGKEVAIFSVRKDRDTVRERWIELRDPEDRLVSVGPCHEHGLCEVAAPEGFARRNSHPSQEFSDGDTFIDGLLVVSRDCYFRPGHRREVGNR